MSFFVATTPIFAGPMQDLKTLQGEIGNLVSEVETLSEAIESGEKSYIGSGSKHEYLSLLEQETSEIHQQLEEFNENPTNEEIDEQIKLMGAMVVRLKLSLISIKKKVG